MEAQYFQAVEPQIAPSRSQRSKNTNVAAVNNGRARTNLDYDLLDQNPLAQYDESLPAAPEVPRGPPISYQPSYGGNVGGQIPARSFSQRAKGQMLAQEILLNDNDWEEQDRISSQARRREKQRETIPQDPIPSSLQNGQESQAVEPKRRRKAPTAQRDVSTDESPQSTGTAKRDRPHSLRHSADFEPLRVEVDSPSTQPTTIQSPSTQTNPPQRDLAYGRSPLQTLEVKLNDISKEEKRARVLEAEMVLRESKAGRNRGSTRDPQSLPQKNKSIKRPQPESKIPEPVVDRKSATLQQKPQRDDPTDPRRNDNDPLPKERREDLDTRDRQREDFVGGGNVQPLSVQKTLATDPSRSRRQSAPVQEDSRDLTPKASLIEPVPIPMEASPSYSSHEPYDSLEFPQQKPRRLQKDGNKAGFNRQAAVAQSIPSNITRAVSLQTRQPQPVFADDLPVSRPGPAARDSNASHKAVLAEASTSVGASGATASTAIKTEGVKKLQKPLPGSLNRGSYQAPDGSQVVSPRKAAASSSIEDPGVNPEASLQSSKVEFYYRGMPKEVEVQKSNSLRGAPPAQMETRELPSAEPAPPMERPRRASVSFKVPFDKARPVNEWKLAGTARLEDEDMELDTPTPQDQPAWWEQDERSGSQKNRGAAVPQISDAYSLLEDTRRVQFSPALYLKCGPLLRYTGLRTERENEQAGQVHQPEGREFWRGSVMIVTQDSLSSFEEVPSLRLYAQPRNLLPPPPEQVQGDDLAPEYVDPVAGLIKVSRRGQSLFVKPVDHLEVNKDLSRIETDDGLFETSPSPPEGHSNGSQPPIDRSKGIDGEALGKYSEVKGARLYVDIERDVTFWRFNIEVELGEQQAHIAYRINKGPPVGFWVPAKGQSMNIMFHSCNGFNLTVNADQFSGPDPLWRDVLNTHQTRPFHVMIGGGDQLYNDRVMVDTKLFAAWTHMRNPHEKNNAPFTDEMSEELESFYLNRYSTCFSTGLFGLANSQIPMVNIYDDHDIIDGFGSYPDHFQKTPVFKGIGNIAFKYYMLFQHQSVPEETQAEEPSWILGAAPGPYIQQRSRHVFVHLGRSIAFLGLDCRTERERYSVLTNNTYDIVLARCRKEIEEGMTRHLLVLLGVPIAYPRLVWLENILTSRAMAPVKALGRAGYLKGGFLNRFEGGVEVLDDLDDHWTATGHKDERHDLILDLQELAAEKSVRITILGGDVHLAGIGQFYSDPKLRIPKDKDHRYMPNVISSAIVNTPPPEMLADTLNKRNKTHRMDPYTLEDMIPMFTHDVDGKKRNNKRLLPRRNWCAIREYHPGSTPPPTPPESPVPFDQESEADDMPVKPRRRMSLSREDVNPRNLIRRLSQRAPPTSYRDEMVISSPTSPRRASHDGRLLPMSPQTAPPTRTSFPANNAGGLNRAVPQTAPPNQTEFDPVASHSQQVLDDELPSAPYPRPGIFRRPTNLSEKAAKKGGPPPAYDSQGNLIAEDLNDHVNLENGLDITLNCEVHQGDPAGITTPYRFLVPALMYDGTSDNQKLDGPSAAGIQRKPTLLKKLGFGRVGDRKAADRQGQGNWGQASDDDSVDEEVPAAEPEQYREPRSRSNSIGGGLKRLFSGRKVPRQHDIYDEPYPQPNYDDGRNNPPGAQTRGSTREMEQYEPLASYNTGSGTSKPFRKPLTDLDPTPANHNIQPSNPQTRTQPRNDNHPNPLRSSITSTTSATSTIPPPSPTSPITPDPFPARGRGKAARLLGVDVGSEPHSQLPLGSGPASAPLFGTTSSAGAGGAGLGLGTQSAPRSRAKYTSNNPPLIGGGGAGDGTALNQSSPLPPLALGPDARMPMPANSTSQNPEYYQRQGKGSLNLGIGRGLSFSRGKRSVGGSGAASGSGSGSGYANYDLGQNQNQNQGQGPNQERGRRMGQTMPPSAMPLAPVKRSRSWSLRRGSWSGGSSKSKSKSGGGVGWGANDGEGDREVVRGYDGVDAWNSRTSAEQERESGRGRGRDRDDDDDDEGVWHGYTDPYGYGDEDGQGYGNPPGYGGGGYAAGGGGDGVKRRWSLKRAFSRS